MKKGSRAVLQFYPEFPEQSDILTKLALESGFTGGVLVDNPKSKKAKKWFLILDSGLIKDDVATSVNKNKFN